MFDFGGKKRRPKSPAAQLAKVNRQIQKEQAKLKLKAAKAKLAQMRNR